MNARKGAEGIHKRLDKLLVKRSFLQTFQRYRSCVGEVKLSYHWSVFLQLDDDKIMLKYPFKSNSSWLLNDDLCKSYSGFLVEFQK